MTKLCARGKSAAKRKFRVYPSAYANAYASKICAGKIKDPSGTKRKDFKGPKPAGAKVGMAVTAGSQSGMGRLQKSGLMKANKGAIMDNKRDLRKTEQVTGKQENKFKDMRPKKTLGGKLGIKGAGERAVKKGILRKDNSYSSGGLARGGGAAIRGTKFEGVF